MAKLLADPTTFLHDSDDFEPCDAGERCDAAYGNYHIGREDETRDELALLFDARWLPDVGFLTDGLWAIIHRNGGRLMAFSVYTSTKHSDDRLQGLLRTKVSSARSFDVVRNAPLSVAVLELARPATFAVDNALRAYTAYVGYGNISWPSDFRSIVTAEMNYL